MWPCLEGQTQHNSILSLWLARVLPPDLLVTNIFTVFTALKKQTVNSVIFTEMLLKAVIS